MEYIIMPIVILIIYNIFKEEKIRIEEYIAYLVLLGGGFFISDKFDGFSYYVAIVILATVVVSID